MQQAGCKGINIGIETGDATLLAQTAKQGLTVDRIMQLTDYCKSIAIQLHFLLMVGLPGESRDALFETFKLVDMLQPESVGITTVTPYPGTKLYDDAVQNGWIIRPDVNSFSGHGYNLQIGELGPAELKFARDHIRAVANLRERTPEEAFTLRQILYDEFRTWQAAMAPKPEKTWQK